MNRLFAIAAVIVTGFAVVVAKQGQTFDRVDAGGPRLRMLMAGSGGGATVVFEAGAGSSLEEWVRVQPAVSRFARTISYDRAGIGLSDRGPTPRDGRQIAVELHTALHRAQVPPPFILVGHSLGGPFIRVFAGIYPDEVAAMVLVDPTQEELIAWAKAREPRPAEHEFRAYDEVDCAPLTFKEASESPVPNVPVFLIAGMGPRSSPGFLTKEMREEVATDRKVLYPAKLKFYQQWLQKIPNGRLIVTENNGHGIQFEEPELVVSAVRRAVEQVKNGRRAESHFRAADSSDRWR